MGGLQRWTHGCSKIGPMLDYHLLLFGLRLAKVASAGQNDVESTTASKVGSLCSCYLRQSWVCYYGSFLALLWEHSWRSISSWQTCVLLCFTFRHHFTTQMLISVLTFQYSRIPVYDVAIPLVVLSCYHRYHHYHTSWYMYILGKGTSSKIMYKKPKRISGTWFFCSHFKTVHYLNIPRLSTETMTTNSRP